jgi:hypothetical protein
MVSRRNGPTASGGKCKYGKAKKGPRKGLCRMTKKAKKA